MSALTRWVLAHKKPVVLTWLAPTVTGMMAAGPATEALESELSVPDRESWETNVSIAERFQDTGGDAAPLITVVDLGGGVVDDPAVIRDLEALDRRLAEALPSARVASYASTGDAAFVSGGYGSAALFTEGFAAAVGIAAALSALGALASLAVPDRRRHAKTSLAPRLAAERGSP